MHDLNEQAGKHVRVYCSLQPILILSTLMDGKQIRPGRKFILEG